MSRRLKRVALVALLAPWGACILAASACGNGDESSGLQQSDATTSDAGAADGAATPDVPDAPDAFVAPGARDAWVGDGDDGAADGPGPGLAADASDSGEGDGPDSVDSGASVQSTDAADQADSSDADSSDAVASGDSGSDDGAVEDGDVENSAPSDGEPDATGSGGPVCPYSATANQCALCTSRFCSDLFPCMANATCAPALAEFAACVDAIDAQAACNPDPSLSPDGCVSFGRCGLPPLGLFDPSYCDSSDCAAVARGLEDFKSGAFISCNNACDGAWSP